MDRLANIEAFVEAAERGSFTRAARRLRITPSALSRRVAQLEEHVGVRLFHRTTRALRLSAEGRAFFERARAALRELHDAETATSGLRARPAGVLRVAAPSILGRHVVTPALRSFLARHAEVQVELTLGDEPVDLASGAIDVAVRMGTLADSGLLARTLGRSEMRLCASPDYLARHGTPRSVAALGRHERLALALHGRVVDWHLRAGQRERVVPPGQRVVVDSGDALVDFAVAGAGIAWVCDFMLDGPARAGHLVEILPETASVSLPVHALSLPSRHALPKVRAFVDLLAAELAKSAR